MRKILKLLLIALMILGVALSIMNIMSVDNMADRVPAGGSNFTGTWDPSNRRCAGAPLNC